jgi:RimJ/RimL family protein N-acetyltransferase
MGEPPELDAGAARLVGVRPEHVEDLLRILATEPVRRRWGDEGAHPGWPFDDPSETRFSVLLEGRVVGMVQYHEELEPMYRHAAIDVFLDPELHGRHVGRAVVGAVARHLIEDRGHHRLVIDPAADNEPAIRCYRAVGFRPVGIMRRYERDVDGDRWHDGLLMDLLAEELEP